VLHALTALPRPGPAAAGHRRGGACPSDARPTTNAVIFARRAYLCDTGTWTIATAPGAALPNSFPSHLCASFARLHLRGQEDSGEEPVVSDGGS
jgi:hypothetical protein